MPLNAHPAAPSAVRPDRRRKVTSQFPHVEIATGRPCPHSPQPSSGHGPVKEAHSPAAVAMSSCGGRPSVGVPDGTRHWDASVSRGHRSPGRGAEPGQGNRQAETAGGRSGQAAQARTPSDPAPIGCRSIGPAGAVGAARGPARGRRSRRPPPFGIGRTGQTDRWAVGVVAGGGTLAKYHVDVKLSRPNEFSSILAPP